MNIQAYKNAPEFVEIFVREALYTLGMNYGFDNLPQTYEVGSTVKETEFGIDITIYLAAPFASADGEISVQDSITIFWTDSPNNDLVIQKIGEISSSITFSFVKEFIKCSAVEKRSRP